MKHSYPAKPSRHLAHDGLIGQPTRQLRVPRQITANQRSFSALPRTGERNATVRVRKFEKSTNPRNNNYFPLNGVTTVES